MGFIKKYLVWYSLFVVGLVVFIRWYKQSNFSAQRLTEMMTASSKFKDQTNDPCHYSLVGEPQTPGNYLKLTFVCADKEARFSLDFQAIPNKTVGGAIGELFRFNGVKLELTRLKCKQGGAEVEMADKIQAQDNIECRL